MGAQQNHTTWTCYLSGTTGAVAAGSVLCLNAAGTRYVVSTAANRTLVGRGSAVIAITAGDDDDPRVEGQFVGVVPDSIGGLGAGASGPVRVSSIGRLERVASPTAEDEVVGRCDADGVAYLNFATQAEILAGGQPPGAPDLSVQFNNGGAFTGATGVFIADGADLAFGGDPPSEGQVRLSQSVDDAESNWCVSAKSRTDTTLLLLQRWASAGPAVGDQFAMGFNYWGSASWEDASPTAFEYGWIGVNQDLFLCCLQEDSLVGGDAQGLHVQHIGVSDPTLVDVRLTKYTNFAISGTAASSLSEAYYGGGRSVSFQGRATTVPTSGSGATGIVSWVDSNDRLHYVRPSGQRVPVWDGPQLANTSTGTLHNVATLDASGVPVRRIKFTGANPQITGFDDGREGRSLELMFDGDTALVLKSQNTGSDAENRLILPRSDTYVLANQTVRLDWDSVTERWRFEGISVAPSGSTDDVVGISSSGQLKSLGPMSAGGGSPGTPNKSVQYRVDGSTFGGEANWTRESTGRINVTTSGFVTYGADSDFFPAAGFLRVSLPSPSLKKIIQYYDGTEDITILAIGIGDGTDISIGASNKSLFLQGAVVNLSGNALILTDNTSAQFGVPLKGLADDEQTFRMAHAAIAFSSSNVTLSDAEAACPFLTLYGTTDGTEDLIAPDLANTVYNIRNTTADTIVLKKSGGSGVSIIAGAKGWFLHNGTDYEART